MTQQPFHQITTRDVARQCKIPESTLFRYYPTKAYILEGLLGVFQEEFQQKTQMMDPTLSEPEGLRQRYAVLIELLELCLQTGNQWIFKRV